MSIKDYVAQNPIILLFVLFIQHGINLPREPVSISSLIWLGIFPSAVSYYLFNVGSESVSATIMATSGLLIPIVSSILAFIMLSETFNLTEIIGAALVIAGLMIAYMKN